jgi:hypothetical protein
MPLPIMAFIPSLKFKSPEMPVRPRIVMLCLSASNEVVT